MKSVTIYSHFVSTPFWERYSFCQISVESSIYETWKFDSDMRIESTKERVMESIVL